MPTNTRLLYGAARQPSHHFESVELFTNRLEQAGTFRRKFQSDDEARPDAASCSCHEVASLTAIRLARPILRSGNRPALTSRYAVERLQLLISQNCLMVMNRSMVAPRVA
jgi:hypothetical protein